MRTVNSVFWAALQTDRVDLAELVDLTTPSQVYRWTTANVPIQVGGTTYDPFPGAARDGAEESTDLGVGTIDFVTINSGDLNQLMMANGLDTAPVVVSRVFVNSPNLGRLYVFRGTLGDIGYDRNVISGQVRNLFNGVAGRFPRYAYQDTCVWRFGSTGCGYPVNSATVAIEINAAASNPLVLSAAAPLAPGSASWYDRGRLTMTSGANSGHVRSIRSHNEATLLLSHALPYAVESGATASIFPGCRKRLVEDCIGKYNNAHHFFGFPWIPKTENAF